jgi:hypothetical protein
MKRRVLLLSVLTFFVLAAVAVANAVFNQATPNQFDPGKTYLVQSSWLHGIGCPTDARTFDGSSTGSFTAAGCPTGDPNDKANEGLLLAKTGPTANDASAYAVLKNVKGEDVTELGYDIRKPGVDQTDPRGSHCGAGAPRFNVTTSSGTQFIGCNSPAPVVEDAGDGWLRLRWEVNIPDVQSIAVLFDEGQDTGPDNFGAAILDNIDVNGVLVGRGDTNAN